jgi:hypothetical protein
MQAHRRKKIRELRDLVSQGNYPVDPVSVADAVMQRLSGPDLALDYARLLSSADPGPEPARIKGSSFVSTRHARTGELAA